MTYLLSPTNPNTTTPSENHHTSYLRGRKTHSPHGPKQAMLCSHRSYYVGEKKPGNTSFFSSPQNARNLLIGELRSYTNPTHEGSYHALYNAAVGPSPPLKPALPRGVRTHARPPASTTKPPYANGRLATKKTKAKNKKQKSGRFTLLTSPLRSSRPTRKRREKKKMCLIISLRIRRYSGEKKRLHQTPFLLFTISISINHIARV